MRIKNAFTLAEVLITLTIIGVVAALTLPILNDKIGDMVLENQRKKAQSVLANGVKMMLAQQGETNLANTELKRCRTDRACLAAEVGKYFKIVADDNTKNKLFATLYEFEGDAIASNDFNNMNQLKEERSVSDEMERANFRLENLETKDNLLLDKKINTQSISGDYAVWEDPGMNYVFVTSDGMMFGIMNNDASRNTLTIVADVNGGGLPNSGGRDLCTYNIGESGALSETCSGSFIPTAVSNTASKELKTETKDSLDNMTKSYTKKSVETKENAVR